jgi:diacylglycerol kinase family enzyme
LPHVTVDLVINRNARHLGETSPVRRALATAATRHGARVHETRTLEELAQVARSLAERGTSAVVLAGGDGSHMAGVSALWRAFGEGIPPVALAPGGTVGIVASNLAGGRGTASARAGRLVRAVCEGTAVETSTPTLRVRDDASGDRVAFIFGAGLVARFFDVYDAAPRQGLVAAANLATRAFLGSIVGTEFSRRVLTPVACVVEVDGVQRPSRAWSLVLASVVKDVGLGIHATYRAGERSDRFHAVASTRSPRGLATQVPRVMTGRAMAGEDQVDELARVMRVRFEGGGAYVVDGDVVRAGEVTVEPGPVVRVMVG